MSTRKTRIARSKAGRTSASPPSTAPASAAGLHPSTAGVEKPDETVLLAVVGMSPAILTETIWALAHPTDGTGPVIPSRVVVVTTALGREQVGQLLQPSTQLGGRTPWDALRQALEQEGHDLRGKLRFGLTGDDVRVITAADPATGRSVELSDIRSPRDSEAAADFLLDQVRAIVENPDTRLVASLAGGRKTMGALLYACMTMAGREHDRLTHVLVNEPFETLREFYFPTQPGGDLTARDGLSISPTRARIEMAEVTFVPLRNLFERDLGRKAGTFSRLVESCRTSLRRRVADQLRPCLDIPRAELELGGRRFKLAPAEMLLFWFLACRAKQGEPPFATYKDALDRLNQFRAEQLEARKEISDWRQAGTLRAAWDDRAVVKAVADLRDRLRRAGGDAALLATCLPEKGRCSLDVPGELIFLKG